MSFPTAIAGPSRIPFRAAWRVVRPAAQWTQGNQPSQRYSSTAADAPEDGAPILNAEDEREFQAKRKQQKAFASSREAYIQWLETSGKQYASVAPGEKANWLGGEVPFSTNPTFRPPPPLSNDLQDMIYTRLKQGATVAQLSQQYSISKARIEGIKKLKAIEAEFLRQDLPLQRAFLDGMEPLLGVKSPYDARTRAFSPVCERDEMQARMIHPVTTIEQVEEDRFEAGIGAGGAFGNRVAAEEGEGIERTAWEFKDEETVVGERREAAREAAKVGKEEVKKGKQEKREEDEKVKVPISKVYQVDGRIPVRFVDTSKRVSP